MPSRAVRPAAASETSEAIAAGSVGRHSVRGFISNCRKPLRCAECARENCSTGRGKARCIRAAQPGGQADPKRRASLSCFFTVSVRRLVPLTFNVGLPSTEDKGQTNREDVHAKVGERRLFKALRSGTLAASAPGLRQAEGSEKLEAWAVQAGRCIRIKGLVPPSHQTAGKGGGSRFGGG